MNLNKIRKNIRKMRKHSMNAIIIVCLVSAGLYKINSDIKASDDYVRDAVVKLTNDKKGSCSGIKVKTANDDVVILSAAHCMVILDANKQMKAIDRHGNEEIVTFIAEDEMSDLMILSTDDEHYVDIADSTVNHEKAHAITHGRGHDAYRSDGEIMEIALTQIPIFSIENVAMLNQCMSMPKYVPYATMFGPYCVLETEQQWSSVQVVGGSSGGGLLNEAGEVIGITSAGDGTFGAFVTLKDIKNFISQH